MFGIISFLILQKKYYAASLSEKYILNPKNFDKLPFLTRQELESVPLDERLLLTPEKFNLSLTLQAPVGKPMITYFANVDDYYFDPTLDLGVRRLLIIHPPLNKHFHPYFCSTMYSI